MSFEYSFDSSREQTGHFSRMNPEPISLYDMNSRDSGYEETPSESLGDDDFLEEFAEINFIENTKLPTDFSNLIQKPIVAVTINKRPTLRRAFSLEETVSPLKKKICQRPETEESQDFFIKRKKVVRKSSTEECDNAVVPHKSQPKLSSSEEVIKSAIQKSYSEPNLVGDFSRSYSLPLTKSRHQDLRSIDGNTLKGLLDGEFSDRIKSFKIIDCRYPYEYNGGHIVGAFNLYTHEQCLTLLDKSSSNEHEKPSILIFHCEFSVERGPNLYRYLRKEDRMRNADIYPYLCFPEMYILEGGYRKCFEENSNICTPGAYTQMLDPKHRDDLKCFRQKSKTWDSDVLSSSKRSNKFKNVKKLAL